MLKSLLFAVSLAIATFTATLMPQSAGAQGKAPAKGVNYVELNPAQPIDSPGKVEVIEFFWYGCPHCYALEPLIEPWMKKLPRDTVFKRVPAVFNEQWGVAARVYYALETLGDEERVRRQLFDAIHKDNLKITDESAMAGWVGKHGINAEKYKAAYRSFTVETKLRRATQMTQTFRLSGVPTFAVQGKYLIGAELNNDRQQLLDVTDFLIAESRKQLPKK